MSQITWLVAVILNINGSIALNACILLQFFTLLLQDHDIVPLEQKTLKQTMVFSPLILWSLDI